MYNPTCLYILQTLNFQNSLINGISSQWVTVSLNPLIYSKYFAGTVVIHIGFLMLTCLKLGSRNSNMTYIRLPYAILVTIFLVTKARV